MDGDARDENVEWTRRAYAALRPFLAERRYLNYMSDDDVGEEPARAGLAPPTNGWPGLKAGYDPDNVFELNLNVPPR